MQITNNGGQAGQPTLNSIVNGLMTPRMYEVVNNFLPYMNSNNSNAYNPYQSNDSTYGYDSNTASTQSSYLNLLAGMIGSYANKPHTNGAYTSNNTNYWGAMGGYGGSYSSQPYSFLGNNTSTAYTGNVDSTNDYATTCGDTQASRTSCCQ